MRRRSILWLLGGQKNQKRAERTSDGKLAHFEGPQFEVAHLEATLFEVSQSEVPRFEVSYFEFPQFEIPYFEVAERRISWEMFGFGRRLKLGFLL